RPGPFRVELHARRHLGRQFVVILPVWRRLGRGDVTRTGPDVRTPTQVRACERVTHNEIDRMRAQFVPGRIEEPCLDAVLLATDGQLARPRVRETTLDGHAVAGTHPIPFAPVERIAHEDGDACGLVERLC